MEPRIPPTTIPRVMGWLRRLTIRKTNREMAGNSIPMDSYMARNFGKTSFTMAKRTSPQKTAVISGPVIADLIFAMNPLVRLIISPARRS